jgi:hypothetical protein
MFTVVFGTFEVVAIVFFLLGLVVVVDDAFADVRLFFFAESIV